MKIAYFHVPEKKNGVFIVFFFFQIKGVNSEYNFTAFNLSDGQKIIPTEMYAQRYMYLDNSKTENDTSLQTFFSVFTHLKP